MCGDSLFVFVDMVLLVNSGLFLVGFSWYVLKCRFGVMSRWL